MRAFMRQLLPTKVGAEIGVYHGGNAIEIFNTLDLDKLHLVDHYQAYEAPEAHVFVTQEKQDESKALAFKNLEHLKDKIEWHIKPSVEAAEDIPDESLDFVYIDATHSYEALTEDLNAWYQKVRTGGLVSGHDWEYATIRQAVLDFTEPHGHQVKDDGDWWFIK